MNRGMRLGVAVLSLLLMMQVEAEATDKPATLSHIYSTWEGLEADKLASCWLIKRFIDEKAEFRFFLSGELIEEGIPFDTPDSKWVRTHDRSAFEVILADKKLEEPALKRMGRIIHDIEINLWYMQYPDVSGPVKTDLNKIIEENSDYKECLERAFEYFDALYVKLREEDLSKEGKK